MRRVSLGFVRLLFYCFVLLTNLYLPFQTTAQTTPDAFAQEILAKESEARNASKLWNAADVQRALELYLEAAEQWNQIGNTSRSTANLREAAKIQAILGNNENTLSLLEKALKIERKSENLSGQAETLSLMSLTALQLGQIDETRKYFTQALLLSEQTTDLAAKGAVYASAAEFYYYQRNFSEQQKYLRPAIEMFRATGNRRDEAQALLNLAYGEGAQSNFLAGLELAQEALAICRDAGEKRGQALALIATGYMHTKLSDKNASLNAYFEAESLFPNDLDQIEKARLYNGIGSIYEDYGEWELSLNYREKAFQSFKNAKHAHRQLATLPSLGKLSALSGNRAAALDYFTQAEYLAKKLNDKFVLAFTWKELGNFYKDGGENEKALKNYQRALILYQKSNLKIDIAEVLGNIGRIYERQGKIEAARRQFQSALEINRSIKSRFAEAESFFDLARVEIADGKITPALDSIEKSLNLTESVRAEIASPKLRRTFHSQIYARYELYTDLLMQMHSQFPAENYDVRALQASERGRARTLIETLRQSGVEPTANVAPELQKSEKELRSKLNLKANALTDALSNSADKATIDKIEREIEEVSAQYEQINFKLGNADSRFALFNQPREFDLRRFQNEILDDKTILLEFDFGQKRSFLWAVSPDKIETIELPAQADFDERINRLLELLSDRQHRSAEDVAEFQKRIAEQDAKFQIKAQELSDILLGAAAEKIKGKRLLVVPDGGLHYLPLAALPAPAVFGKNSPLVAENEIIYQPSAATLLLLQENFQSSNLPDKTMLVFADPVFSIQDERIAAKGANQTNAKDSTLSIILPSELFRSGETGNSILPRLTASQTEATTIAQLADWNQATIISGAAANRERVFQSDIGQYKIVHFAAHGVLNEEKPEFSGIVLSLFDENGEPREGFLRLHDIYSLRLASDLVVLSACQSGVGKEIKGEGAVSLTRGFLQAGSKSVLSSLWKVEDVATAELMRHFYEALLKERLAPSAALRQAQLKMSENPRWRSPFYWAAFTLQGEYRHSIITTSNQSKNNIFLWLIAAFSVIFILCLFGFFKLWRSKLDLQTKAD